MHIDADVAPDLGFKISSNRLDKLFEDAAISLTQLILDTHTILRKETKKLELFSTSLEELLHSWLSEINYLFVYEGFVCAEVVVEISEEQAGEYRLNATVAGQSLDESHHHIRTKVKNTFVAGHKLEQLDDGTWSAAVYVFTTKTDAA